VRANEHEAQAQRAKTTSKVASRESRLLDIRIRRLVQHCLSPLSDSVAKISKLTFAQLLVDKTGLSLMWTIINAGLPGLSGVPVPPSSSSKCKTAGDVLDAAKKST
jgi:hypothetical protein